MSVSSVGLSVRVDVVGEVVDEPSSVGALVVDTGTADGLTVWPVTVGAADAPSSVGLRVAVGAAALLGAFVAPTLVGPGVGELVSSVGASVGLSVCPVTVGADVTDGADVVGAFVAPTLVGPGVGELVSSVGASVGLSVWPT